jgi:2-(1,2-epoxy-1,2-dihydrophenyl)acetyl-CoA isomerase
VAGQKIDLNKPSKINDFQKKQIRAIEINMLMAYIRKILNFKKLIIIAMQGEVVTPFFGLSLACDLRIIAENTYFSLSHINYGIHPSAGLPFFLPKFISPTRANEYLLLGGKISAREAKELSLVNKVISDENFLQDAIKESQKLCSVNNNFIKVTKTLINNVEDELTKYFEKESHYLYN